MTLAIYLHFERLWLFLSGTYFCIPRSLVFFSTKLKRLSLVDCRRIWVDLTAGMRTSSSMAPSPWSASEG
jgi:hypothetical protein